MIIICSSFHCNYLTLIFGFEQPYSACETNCLDFYENIESNSFLYFLYYFNKKYLLYLNITVLVVTFGAPANILGHLILCLFSLATPGVTTVLAMVTLGFGGRSSFPEVAYATALDYFVILCLVFVFAAVIEFASINFLERRANKRRKKMEDLKKKIVEQLTMVCSLLKQIKWMFLQHSCKKTFFRYDWTFRYSLSQASLHRLCLNISSVLVLVCYVVYIIEKHFMIFIQLDEGLEVSKSTILPRKWSKQA